MRKFDYGFLDNGLLPSNLVDITSGIYALQTAAGERKSQYNVHADFSHAEGYKTTTLGNASHADGVQTTTRNYGEHASGIANVSHYSIFNDDKSGSTIFSIGIGHEETQNSSKEEENAIEVMKNGYMYINGVAQYDGKSLDNTHTVQHFLDMTPLSNYEYELIFMTIPDWIINLHIYIDDFPEDQIDDIFEAYGCSNIDELVEYIIDDPGATGINELTFVDIIEIDNANYYMFSTINEMYGIMPTSITLAQLQENSMQADSSNRWCPFTAVFFQDFENIYDEDLDEKYSLVFINISN